MSFSNKIDAKTLGMVLIALIGGVIGGYISNTAMKDTQIEGLSNALTVQLISKDTEIAALRNTVSVLERQVLQLEGIVEEMESIPVVGINTPDFDSGWITTVDPGWDGTHFYVRHNLGTENLFVYLLGRTGVDYYLHQVVIGQDPYEKELHDVWLAYGNDTLLLRRNPEAEWTMIRVLLWVLPDPP